MKRNTGRKITRSYDGYEFEWVPTLHHWLYTGRWDHERNQLRKRVHVYPPTRKQPLWRVVVDGEKKEKFLSGPKAEEIAFSTAIQFARN